MKKDKSQQILRLAKTIGILRPKDLAARGIAPVYLYRLCKKGLLQKAGRGLFTLPNQDLGHFHTYAEANKTIPHGTICLLSALSFHELTTQSPFQIWMAIDNKAHQPTPPGIQLRIVRFSGDALLQGVEEHKVAGIVLRVYNPTKTVADCFKFRNKIGLDVAMEALKDWWRQRKGTMDELWKYAKICRVQNVMRPYMEMLTA